MIQENGNIYGYCIYIISKKNKINYAQILDIAVLKSHQKKKISLLRTRQIKMIVLFLNLEIPIIKI